MVRSVINQGHKVCSGCRLLVVHGDPRLEDGNRSDQSDTTEQRVALKKYAWLLLQVHRSIPTNVSVKPISVRRAFWICLTFYPSGPSPELV